MNHSLKLKNLIYRSIEAVWIFHIYVYAESWSILLNTAALKDLPFTYIYVGTLPALRDLLYKVLFCLGLGLLVGFFCMKYVCLAYESYILQPV